MGFRCTAVSRPREPLGVSNLQMLTPQHSMQHRAPALILLAAAPLLPACAPSRPLPPPSTDPAVIAQCRNLMYISRVPRGPPNWNMYEQCLRGMR